MKDEDIPAALALAKQKALDKADELYAEYRADYRQQAAGYAFKCHRLGDWLTLHTTRNANKTPKHRTQSVALNLGLVTHISWRHGREPDRIGLLSFELYDGRIEPILPEIWPDQDSILTQDRGDLSFNWYQNRKYLQGEYLQDYPHPAEDSIITFHGTPIKLLVPLQMTDEIINTILHELQKDYEPKTMPTIGEER